MRPSGVWYQVNPMTGLAIGRQITTERGAITVRGTTIIPCSDMTEKQIFKLHFYNLYVLQQSYFLAG